MTNDPLEHYRLWLQSRGEYFEPVPASEPCQHEPGSAEKIRTMTERLERGQELHHPGDRKLAWAMAG